MNALPPGLTGVDPMPYGYRRWNGAVWAEFIGLSAWQFEPDWEESETATMEERAGVRLYVIAQAVASSIADDIAATITNEDG